MDLLKQSYKNDNKALKVMDKHLDLITTMGKTDSIKDCEKHQKKTLKQIRELILQIVIKRKLREINQAQYGVAYVVPPLSKPPNLAYVRRETKKNNLTSAYRLMSQIYQRHQSNISRPTSK